MCTWEGLALSDEEGAGLIMGEHQQFLCFLFAETHKLPPARKHTHTQMIDECDDKIKRAEQKEKAVGRDSHHVSK